MKSCVERSAPSNTQNEGRHRRKLYSAHLDGILRCKAQKFYRSIETGTAASFWPTRPTRRRGKPLHQQRSELGSDPFDRDVFLGIPGGNCVAHAKDCERRKARICV